MHLKHPTLIHRPIKPIKRWRVHVGPALIVASIVIFVGAYFLMPDNTFLPLSFFGIIAGFLIGGDDATVIRSAANRWAYHYETVALTDGLSLELYQKKGFHLAPVIRRNPKIYRNTSWHQPFINLREWEIRHSQKTWTTVVQAMSAKQETTQRGEYFFTDGTWVFMSHEGTLAMRYEDWEKLVKVLSERGVYKSS